MSALIFARVAELADAHDSKSCGKPCGFESHLGHQKFIKWVILMIIRKFEAKDIDQAYNLLNELYENEIQYPIFTRKYEECLNDNNFYGIIAEEDGKVVGVLVSRLINRLVKTKSILFIDDLIVDKNYRSNGIGRLLLQDAIDYAIKNDCETVELTSYITNENSHRFYQNNGFKKQHYKFKKHLD